MWSYAGIRPLYDDKAANASAVTRDYVLDLDEDDGALPLLSVFGGKITTYRKLAEHALEKLKPFLSHAGAAWTAGAALPGGDMPDADFDRYLAGLRSEYPGLPPALVDRLARAYGTGAATLLGDARTPDDLGRDFGGGLHAREVDHLIAREWARSSDDILFRRSKLGLRATRETSTALAAYLGEQQAA